MRRWNGWGDSANDYPLKPAGAAFLEARLGAGQRLADADLDQVLASVPASRLAHHPLVDTAPETRVRHARGQSLADWLAMRSGDFGVFPDGVAFPESGEQVRELLDWCRDQDVLLIPYGGGTSVAGHINPRAGDRPVLTLSLARLDRLTDLDEASQVATFGAGTPGPSVERQLAERGYRLGHYPQSWELSTLGGWVASRSSGQQSLRYGRIEQLFAGGRVETPTGTLTLPTIPASSAGPDLREMVMGSEGRLGVITEVKVRVSPLPEEEQFHVAFLPDWDSAVLLARRLVQARVPLSMVRVSNAEETRTQLTLAGHERLVAALERYLALRGQPRGRKCMLTFGVTGDKAHCRHALGEARRAIRAAGGVTTGRALGRKWEEARFRSPYLRHGLWERGYAVDTLETCVDWGRVPQTVAAIEQAIRDHAGDGETAHVFTHLSHLYAQGSSIYTTYVFRCSSDYQGTRQRWWAMKRAASDAIVANGGTISHQHGVGRDHAPWLVHEKGERGLAALRDLVTHFDPQGRLNPGCLLED
ncbi:alkylglycerone-phosphate synthase [Alcanivorax sp. 521-1]|uniref:Alkylglycerone-phosphate synthase n=1 Tax=Alloalcanivorax profundimaris TaxID=2735259 RepID=A0ABS0AV60_9GAMM|nr:FAD-binding oxidoreductase [Alloalcanivorax profundimaris]MBF5057366.1 alkylglycerone-phosphate synthase [Alloalcanivorax profundimaris]